MKILLTDSIAGNRIYHLEKPIHFSGGAPLTAVALTNSAMTLTIQKVFSSFMTHLPLIITTRLL